MRKFEQIVIYLANASNWVAAVAIVFLMLLTTLDVILRMFRMSITGSYELAGFASVLVISLSLGYTSLQKGHIAVDIVFRRFSVIYKKIIKFVNCCISFLLFAIISWQSFLYAMQLRAVGEVSATLQLRTYPFVLGLTLGAFLLCLVLIVEAMRVLRGADIE